MKTKPFDFFLSISKYIEEPSEEGSSELKRYVEGFCVVSGNVDEQNDLIDESALQGAIQYLKKYSTVLYNHDQDRPIGTVVDARLVDGRIWVKVLISQSEDEIWQKILEKVLNSFSVSGLIEDFEYQTRDGEQIRVIKKFRIYEISLVSVPANAEAKTLRAYLQKALKGVQKKEKKKMFKSEKVDLLFKEVIKTMDLKDKLKMILKWLSSLEEATEDEKVKEILTKAVKELKDILDALGEKYPYPYPYPQPSEKGVKPEEFEALKTDIQKSIDEVSQIVKDLSGRIAELEKFREEQEEVSKQLVEFLQEFKGAFLGEETPGDEGNDE